ncbi:transketolase-like TK C-terminal-containing protein [Engelhardtia mirabilis]|uniref:Transketolase 2 n=1 Tax=Engelhardtia mirabilis TaxID=2528011 RepID=A0A518BDG4_9BACT|nr:Transketolase 2 [Planctomycetes bacterium Pla133]QDU99354.1 Transketolase 2 [Planctomycetes bacterium Pla86]
MQTLAKPTFDALQPHFPHWETIGDMIDQCIDLMLNLRQSGHPGGSRSKVPLLVASTLGAGMRWDIRHPESPFGDRFVLVAGHCNPAIYAMLAVYNEALRRRHEQTGDARYEVYKAHDRQLLWKHLLFLRHNGGLPGHAEMEGNTLFFKFNTGPSGHGAPAALGEAVALKLAGAGEVKVFAMEGEGGFSAGAHHEVLNSAYGLGTDNLVYLLDWNDHGIDEFANSEVMHGEPSTWFEPHGWRVAGTEHGEDYAEITRALLEVVHPESTGGKPGMVWVKTRKGRGYHKFDAPSHGKAHGRNSEMFWKCREDFASKYDVEFEGHGDTTDPGEDACREQSKAWFETVFSLFDRQPELVEYLADTLVDLGESIPTQPDGFRLASEANMHETRDWCAVDKLPAELFVAPGTKIANKEGFAKFGAWVNGLAAERMGRPLVLAASADLADSTSISGFAKAWGDQPGFGWYDRNKNTTGALLPQQITEFTNSGVAVGMATVNMSATPEEEFRGFWGACSTYGSFSYLKYGLMRLFSQLAQDCPLKVGKVIWVVGHSGPETAEDSRTHFGIFSPGVTQLFPDGHVINLHPWEHNEVAPMLAAALATDVPIVALHLTRPNVQVPDRAALGIPSHTEAARGAYVLRSHDSSRPKDGTILVQGTSTTESVFQILPRLADSDAPNVKVVAAVSYELFMRQEQSYRDSVLPRADWWDSTVITNGARRLMHDWLPHKDAEKFAMSSDHDNRWRTGGNVAELKVEAKIDPESLWEGISRFARERTKQG